MDDKLIAIGEAANRLGVSIDTLRNWDKKNILNAFRPDPKGNRYYLETDIKTFLEKKATDDHETMAEKWAMSKTVRALASDLYCETVDVFSARVQSLNIKLDREASVREIYPLITAIVGEIGNNSFNHNVGNWPDVPGVFFSYDSKRKQIILADRGQGVLKTLQRVLPKLKNHREAVKIAFTKYISGRAPENRGNGLKFVKDIVCANPIQLRFFSGNADLQIDMNHPEVEAKESKNTFHGSMAIINF